MAVEISEVIHGPKDDLITGAWLDFPQKGPVDGDAFHVVGWVVSKAPVAEVEFVHEGSAVARCELSVARPDVVEKYGGSSQVGFGRPIGTVGLAPDFTIKVRVVFQDGRRRQIAEIRGTQLLTPAPTGTGGSGATGDEGGSAAATGGTGGTAAQAAMLSKFFDVEPRADLGAPRAGATAAAGTGGVGGAVVAGGETTGGTAGAGSTAGAGGTGGTRRHRRRWRSWRR
jgi:hypothetical protein